MSIFTSPRKMSKNIYQNGEMDKKEALEKIAVKIRKCQKCSLGKTPKAVPGEGNPEAEIILIGEAPGYHESVQGKPFVGAAGKLLTQLLQSINLKRSEVFICNMLHHRPPGNRGPLSEEIETCKPFLDEQIEIINPKIIVTLGRFAMAKFIPEAKISQIHGQARWVDFSHQRVVVVPMFHPAAALRNGGVMEKVKEDFQKIPKILSSLKDQTAYTSINRSDTKSKQLILC